MLILHSNITATLHSGKDGSKANLYFCYLIYGNTKMHSGNYYT